MEKPIKVSENFNIAEFVPFHIYEKYGDYSTRFICPEIVEVAQGIRDYYEKSVKINDWYYKGSFEYRGFRPADCHVGAKNSAHKRGMAIDFNVYGVGDDQVKDDIKMHYKAYFKGIGITIMELNTPTWTHVSCEWIENDGKLLTIKP